MSALAGLGVVLFVFDLWAVISVFGSEAGMLAKFAWTLLVVFLPVAGFGIWLVAGPAPGRP